MPSSLSRSEQAYEAALRFLASRPRSVDEVRRRLKRRGFESGIVDEALARLVEKGWIDDEEFARYWVTQRETFRPRGPRALRLELRQRGIDRDIADVAVAEVVAAQSASALRAAQQRARSLHGAEESQFKQALISHLLRRGFDYGPAREAVLRVWRGTLDEPDVDLGPKALGG